MSQPANATISINRRVRAFRGAVRHDAVASLTKGLRPLQVSVPGSEDRVAFGARNTSLSDASPYMGPAAAKATRGFPVTVGVVEPKTFAAVHAAAGTTNLDFPVTIGHDKFIQKLDANVSDDLFGQVAAV